MFNSLSTAIPYVVLFSHAVFVVWVLACFIETSISRKIIRFVGERALLLVFLLSLGAVFGSLFYSEVMGFEPCVLCWWQRAFLYPVPIITGLGLWKKDNYVINYVIPLIALSAIIALYQSYVNLGGTSLLPCTAVGGVCSKVYVKEFGYITIPFMSLTVSAYIILIAWIKRKYDKNSNTR